MRPQAKHKWKQTGKRKHICDRAALSNLWTLGFCRKAHWLLGSLGKCFHFVSCFLFACRCSPNCFRETSQKVAAPARANVSTLFPVSCLCDGTARGLKGKVSAAYAYAAETWGFSLALGSKPPRKGRSQGSGSCFYRPARLPPHQKMVLVTKFCIWFFWGGAVAGLMSPARAPTPLSEQRLHQSTRFSRACAAAPRRGCSPGRSEQRARRSSSRPERPSAAPRFSKVA